MVTVRDVAKPAGVSTATVSQVLNDSRWITPHTRRQVLDAVARLNYYPGGIARCLSANITRSVGVLVADITNPFFAAIVRGTEDRLSLILAHMLVALPFMIWVMVPFFESIPQELVEAARVDGASILERFVRIILPISGPGIVTSAILAFVFSWKNFMFSIQLAPNRTKTVPDAIYDLIANAQIDWGGLMTAAVIITLPVLMLMLALVTQRSVVRGLTAGAVKG